MTVGFSRLVVNGTGIALALVIATALGIPGRALASSNEQATSNPASIAKATATAQPVAEHRSTIVNRGHGSFTPSVRHTWSTAEENSHLDPLVRHTYP